MRTKTFPRCEVLEPDQLRIHLTCAMLACSKKSTEKQIEKRNQLTGVLQATAGPYRSIRIYS
ncbi:hypothetical protein KIN20_013178 [Parelaphostrongylus tenuis]|uniref:Uncharacterized protein n=1 Tax=Parelaphostrongylus tenuis TaxID=148309 RepID=A0AAD5MXS9_PARTN|nr:hypothetical protein KIN20_013178 [Parelaphostrongylus tenuis]